MSDAKEVEQLELDESCSPQFARELNRIKTDIVRNVGSNFTKDFFRPLSSNLSDTTAILRVQFVNTLSKMEHKEKKILLKELMKLVLNIPAVSTMGAMYERVIDEMVQYAHKKGVVSTQLCTELLVSTSDFRVCRVDQVKWRFIKDNIELIDYKGIRNVLRYILEYQIRRLPSHLSPEQINELRIVEDIILLILDRDSKLIPPLITLSEIMRGIPKQIHMFPRLTERVASLQIYFRPIADLTHVCGRSFIYPIPLHPSFVPNSSFWEDLGVASIQVQPQHQLPYRPDHCSGKNMYTLYMILRQPMGKDSFPSENKAKTKSHWDILISIMICEAMAKAEALPEHEPIPRYQWDNMVNIVMYGMTQHLLNPKNFFMVLKDLIKSCKYTRARDEVMWIVFQVVGSLGNVLRLDDAVTDIVDLYHKLFDGDVVWMGASDHPAVFARFLAAASTWILLEKEFPDKMPKPNETIKSHIKFIEDGGENFDKNNTAMLAVLANVYRNDSRIGRQVLPALGQLLEITDEAEPLFELSYRRTAINSFTSVPVEFLDALTFRSKKNLLSQCLTAFRSFSIDKLPRPSTFETVVRICQSEDYELAVKEIEVIAQRSLHVCNNGADLAAKDQCYFLFDFLVYRLPHLPAFFKFNSSISTNILGSFIHHLSNTPQNHQIYRLMEHFLMRRWCWSGFHECINNHSALLGATNKEIPLTRYLLHPKSFTTPVDSMSFPVNPEAFKMSMYHFLRSLHVTGHEVKVGSSAFPHLIAGYGWPKKSTEYFPKWALDIIEAKDFSHLQPNFEEIVRTVDEAVDLQRKLSQNQFIIKYGDGSDIQTIHCMLAVIFKFAFDSLESNLDLTSEFFDFRVIEKKTPKDMVIMGNYMVDYIIAFSKYQDHNEQLFKNIAKAAARVVFEFQVMRADRFLLALTIHPATDEDALLCVQIANEFILTADFQDRIRWWHNNNVLRKENAPAEYMKALVKYHDMYPEFEACQLVTKNEMKANPHMPTYYGSLIERLMPILDQFLYVALEQQGYKLNSNVLQVVSMFYRYHPMPIHFMYTVLFITHGKMSRSDAKSFVLGFAAHVEDVHLTDAFVKYNHQKATKELLIMELIDRMAASLDFVLVPPSFVARDWKSAEMGPGAQTLYSACIELMASPHSPEDLVAAMIDVMQIKPHLRPYNVVNLIALLLTALPVTYAEALHAEFIRVFENRETAELTFEELVFDNFEEYQLLNITSRTRSLNVISQAYWTHCNLLLLKAFSNENVPIFLKHVQTEKDLWYTLRLIMPILRRYWENWDTAKVMRTHSDSFGPLFIFKNILEKIGELAENGVEYVYQDHFCDFFYNCKYLFAGDFLRETAITEFAKLPESMRDRLKCYYSQSETARAPTPEKEKSPEKEKTEPAPPAQHWSQQPAAPQPPPQQHHQHHQQPPIHPQPQAPPPQMAPHHHNIGMKQEPRSYEDDYHVQRQQQMMQQQQQQSSHHQMELHHQMPEHQGPPQSVQMHMTPQYPGMGHQAHHHQHQQHQQHQQQQQQQMHQMHQMHQQYGMHHHHPNHPNHPNHPMQQQQMHPMVRNGMNNMTPQQYAYMMQMQQMQQQQHQHHNQYMQQQQQHHNQQMQ